jgi:hypothetical protein
MKFARTVLAVFVGGVLAILFALARQASKETGKSVPGSLGDIPGEAQRLASGARSRATGAVSSSWDTIREKETALMGRIAGTTKGQNAEASIETPGPVETSVETSDQG